MRVWASCTESSLYGIPKFCVLYEDWFMIGKVKSQHLSYPDCRRIDEDTCH